MTEKEDIEDTEDHDEMEQQLNRLNRDRVDDLAIVAHLLGSWMSERKYTIAEQISIAELLRSSILVNYIQIAQMDGMVKFVEEHPGARIVMAGASKTPSKGHPRTFDPDSS